MSNDLISRSALMQSLRGNVLVDVTPNLEQAIAEQPIAYDVDKVVKQIRDNVGDCNLDGCKKFVSCDECRANKAIEIVKSGGIE